MNIPFIGTNWKKLYFEALDEMMLQNEEYRRKLIQNKENWDELYSKYKEMRSQLIEIRKQVEEWRDKNEIEN